MKEEQYWTWPGGHVVLSAVGDAGEWNKPQGVLVLCFDSSQKEWHYTTAQTVLREGSFLISVALLAAYLAESDNDVPTPAPLSRGKGKSERKSKQATSRDSDKQGAQPQKVLDETASILSRLDELRIAEQKAIIEQERSRIAREIHDGAAQQIAHAMYKLEFIQRIFEKLPQVALRDIAQVYDILEESLQDLRRAIASLTPLQLERQGFDAALRELFNSYEPELEIRYDADHADMLPSSLEVPVFRFIQEALNNVRKHARASHVAIRIRALAGLLLVGQLAISMPKVSKGGKLKRRRETSMRPVHPLRTVTQEEEQALERIVKAPSERVDVVKRAKAILAVQAGQS